MPRKPAPNRIILRTDAGAELGRFRTTYEAQAHGDTLPKDLSLVIQTDDGCVMAHRFSAEAV